jgi:hypothetical protein
MHENVEIARSVYADPGGLIHLASARKVAALAALETTGRRSRFKGFRQWEPRELEVEADAPVPIGIDREAMVLEPPLRSRSRPAVLRMRVRLHAPGHSPAARPVGFTVANLERLFDIVRGRS